MTTAATDTSWKDEERWPPTYKGRSPLVSHYLNVDSPYFGADKILTLSFNMDKGGPLYRNEHWHFEPEEKSATPTLPTDTHGNPKLPADTPVAIVGHDCKWCKNYMAMNDYPTTLPAPDGRKILYIDIHDPQQMAYAVKAGYSGPGTPNNDPIRKSLGDAVATLNKLGISEKLISRSMLDVALGKPVKIHGQQASLFTGTKMQGGSFPILLETDHEGKLVTGLSSGLVGTANLFHHIRGEELIDIKKIKKPESPAKRKEMEATCTIALLGRCLQWHDEDLVLSLGFNKPADDEIAQLKKQLGIENAEEHWDKKIGFMLVIPKEKQADIGKIAGLSETCLIKTPVRQC